MPRVRVLPPARPGVPIRPLLALPVVPTGREPSERAREACRLPRRGPLLERVLAPVASSGLGVLVGRVRSGPVPQGPVDSTDQWCRNRSALARAGHHRDH